MVCCSSPNSALCRGAGWQDLMCAAQWPTKYMTVVQSLSAHYCHD
jgi:hypothetical protein